MSAANPPRSSPRWSRDPAAAAPLHTELRELLRIVLDGVLAHSRVVTSPARRGDT
ncbi:hypothetical protein [Streptomyces flaveolus]|uniref:hypothetical protein n=1 Tax=Streptomyces flaveolus TaxID=67297 RepID=UPI0033C23DA9